MIKRIRDKVRQFKPQQQISAEEWEQVEDAYLIAFNFMQPTNPAYIILFDALNDAQEIVLENRVHEVREIRVISDIIQKVFVTGKEEQMNELVGQIKFIRTYLAELQSWIDRKVELEHLEAQGKIVIQRNKEINNE